MVAVLPVSLHFALVFNYSATTKVWHPDAPGVLNMINGLTSVAQK